MDEESFRKEKLLSKGYLEELAREEIFWRQKSRETWLKDGDRNTKFFHTSVKVRRSQNKIFSIKNKEGGTVSDLNQINWAAVKYFSEIFNGVGNQGEDMPQIFSSSVKEEHNKRLMDPMSMEEVKLAILV